MDFRTTPLPDLVADVSGRRVSSRELVEHALARIDALNPQVNAFVAVDADAALAAADAVDRRVAAGDDVGPLAGIPIGVKDLEDAKGFVTTSGSATHAHDAPSTRDSVLVARLKDAGAVVVGKTNTPEFGLKPQTDNPTFGITRNPWDLERTPGGSSGGTSAALASGMVPLATGSDGGGSIRIPSAATALSGLKPSLGRVPSGDTGAPGWHNLTTRGVMARRIRDVAYALDVAVGPHPRDQRSIPHHGGSWSTAVRDPAPPRRVVWSTLGYARVDGEIRAACETAVHKLASAGTDVVELDAVFDEDPGPHLGALVSTYTRRTVAPYRDTPMWSKLDPFVVLAAEMSASGISAVDLVEAEDACHRFNGQLVDVLADVDVLLCPTTCGVMPLASMPATVDELLARVLAGATDLDVERLTKGLDLDRIVGWLQGLGKLNFPRGTVDGEEVLDWTRLTQPFNMTRSPAGTVCAGFTGNGLPIGLQVVGPQHGDVEVLQTVAFLEDLLALDTVAPI